MSSILSSSTSIKHPAYRMPQFERGEKVRQEILSFLTPSQLGWGQLPIRPFLDGAALFSAVTSYTQLSRLSASLNLGLDCYRIE